MPLVKIYWRIFKPVTFGVKAIILCDNEVLLVKNVSESKWHLPGGGIYKSESSYEAVRREVKISNEVKNKNNLEIEISPAMIRRLREYIDGQGYTEKFKVW